MESVEVSRFYDELYFAATQHTKEAFSKKKHIAPPKHYIKTYFSGFTEDPVSHYLASGKGSDHAEADFRFVFIYLRTGIYYS